MYNIDSKRPPSKTQWQVWWSKAKYDPTLKSYVNPDFDIDYFKDMLRGWSRYSDPDIRDRAAQFRKYLSLSKSPSLSPQDWSNLRRQIFFSYQ